ncbi:hypothetical protein Tco_1506835 [Tanacetum coccineum]
MSTPAVLKLPRKSHLEFKEEDFDQRDVEKRVLILESWILFITAAGFDNQSFVCLRPSKLCARAQSEDDYAFPYTTALMEKTPDRVLESCGEKAQSASN